MTTAAPLSAFVITISSLCFSSSSSAFCYFLDRLVYLHACIVLSSSLIPLFVASMKVSIV